MNITVKNASSVAENIVVVRYFQFNGANYLIFTRNEVDESGYQKLYTTKVVNNVGNGINDEIEWNLLRDTIKVIAKANKDNTTLPVQDLNDMMVNGIQIIGEKPFKLTSASVALLSANKSMNNNAVNVNTTPVNSMTAPAVSNDDVVVQNPESVPSTPSPVFNNLGASVQPVSSNVIQPTAINNNIPTGNVVPSLNGEPNQNVLTQPISNFNTFEEPTVNPVTLNESIIGSAVVEPVQNVMPQFDSTTVVSTPVTNSQVITNENSVLQPSLYSDLQTNNNTVSAPVMTDAVNTVQVPQTPVEPAVDYKKLYDEQTLKLNALSMELDKYKSMIEQLKNILK